MNMDCITFRSITPAQKAQQILNRAGIRTGLQRTPKNMEQRGCGYCLRLRSSDRPVALELLNREKIKFLSVFSLVNGGRGRP